MVGIVIFAVAAVPFIGLMIFLGVKVLGSDRNKR
tara:strand:- start:1104 stop:1205 length:102 start_codon:yes stop_codon:yes gene_type:complete